MTKNIIVFNTTMPHSLRSPPKLNASKLKLGTIKLGPDRKKYKVAKVWAPVASGARGKAGLAWAADQSMLNEDLIQLMKDRDNFKAAFKECESQRKDTLVALEAARERPSEDKDIIRLNKELQDKMRALKLATRH